MLRIIAPLYPAAEAYAPPDFPARALRVCNFSTAEFMKMPHAWEIATRHIPSLVRITGAAQAQGMLSTMTPADFAEATGANYSAQITGDSIENCWGGTAHGIGPNWITAIRRFD